MDTRDGHKPGRGWPDCVDQSDPVHREDHAPFPARRVRGKGQDALDAMLSGRPQPGDAGDSVGRPVRSPKHERGFGSLLMTGMEDSENTLMKKLSSQMKPLSA